MAQEALRVAEATFGARHPNTAAALEKLGEVYQAQGKYAEAEPLFKRALDIREKALGVESPEVAQSLNSLGDLYRTHGKYAEAEPLLKRALAIREKQLGHPLCRPGEVRGGGTAPQTLAGHSGEGAGARAR